MNLPKNFQVNWSPRLAAFAAFSPSVQVLNFNAEKSNQPVRTATTPTRMTMNPIQQAIQSSDFQFSFMVQVFVDGN